jgi:hypothetical protein
MCTGYFIIPQEVLHRSYHNYNTHDNVSVYSHATPMHYNYGCVAMVMEGYDNSCVVLLGALYNNQFLTVWVWVWLGHGYFN